VFAYEECTPSVEMEELNEVIAAEKLQKQLCQHIIGIMYYFELFIIQ
jgi:hypothetical protein